MKGTHGAYLWWKSGSHNARGYMGQRVRKTEESVAREKTVGEMMYVHTATRMVVGHNPKDGNKPRVHAFLQEHYGQRATCAKCKKDKAEAEKTPGVTYEIGPDRPSSSALGIISVLILGVLVLFGISIFMSIT